MQNAFGVSCFKRAHNVRRQSQSPLQRHRTPQWRAVDILKNQVILTDVVNLADVRMIQGGDRPSFLLKSRTIRGFDTLNRHDAIQPRVKSLPHLPHAGRTEWREDLIRPDLIACLERHVIDSAKCNGLAANCAWITAYPDRTGVEGWATIRGEPNS